MNILILAGGLGTRLRSVIGETPKPVAVIHDKPFLYYLLKYLEQFSPKSVAISLCYEPDKVKDALKPYSFSYPLTFITEPTPLGTGGGILYCLSEMNVEDCIVLNGDTFFDIDLNGFWRFFKSKDADVLIASRCVEDSGRYGSLVIENDHVQDFKEKGFEGRGLINGGIYALKSSIFEHKKVLESFSFEFFLKENIKNRQIFAKEYKSSFIDIGIPDDFERAKDFLKDKR